MQKYVKIIYLWTYIGKHNISNSSGLRLAALSQINYVSTQGYTLANDERTRNQIDHYLVKRKEVKAIIIIEKVI